MNAVVKHPEDQPQPRNGNNPFASAPIATRPTSNAIADAAQQRDIAEVQAAMVIAQRFPRDPIKAMENVLRACTRPTLAEMALYSYSRGGTDITGPSIRLAEVLAQNWGNIQCGIRELEQRNGASTVEAFAWDIETNHRETKIFQVEHKRFTKRGSYALEDPRDIYEMTANQGSRRLRAVILAVIPGDVTEAAVKQCEETLRANADVSEEGIKKLVAAFEPYGITRQQIEKRIQSRIDAIRPAQVIQLKKVYRSIKDGMSDPKDWFEPAEDASAAAAPDAPVSGNEGAKAALKARAAKSADAA